MDSKMKIAGTYIVWDNKLLIHKRGKVCNKHTVHTFGAPGGKVDPGEDFLTAAIRELEEEAGLKLSKSGFKVLNKVSNERAESVMYMRVLAKKPLVAGPLHEKFADEVDMSFDFDAQGLRGESAGPESGHYWADVNALSKFLDKNPEFSNPFLHDNLVLVRKALRGKTRRISKMSKKLV
jgi:8-oxo-dGTP pyrophosphatase MutT (NUDIX family)